MCVCVRVPVPVRVPVRVRVHVHAYARACVSVCVCSSLVRVHKVLFMVRAHRGEDKNFATKSGEEWRRVVKGDEG